MAIRDLIPWRRRGTQVPVRRRGENPFLALHDEINRLFDRFWSGWDLEPFGDWPAAFEGTFAPRVDVSENDKEVRVQAELPGMDEKDVEVTLADGVLTIQGEKKEEHEEKGEGRYYSECRYGHFRRDIPLPAEVDAQKAEATFKKGVLTVTLPRTPESQERRKRIEVKASS